MAWQEAALNATEVKQYHEDGFVLHDHAFDRAGETGGVVRLSLWNHPGNGIYGTFARCRSLVDSAEALLGGEVYHYHSKMIMKEPKVGGAWAWHQDYGYWYQNGVLFPLLTSAFIALDRATKDNECLQHELTGDQASADLECVNELAKRLDLVYVEREPGDVIFFDANMMHRSDRNHSENPRWSMICCYNAARNDSYKDAHQPRYTPLSNANDCNAK